MKGIRKSSPAHGKLGTRTSHLTVDKVDSALRRRSNIRGIRDLGAVGEQRMWRALYLFEEGR